MRNFSNRGPFYYLNDEITRVSVIDINNALKHLRSRIETLESGETTGGVWGTITGTVTNQADLIDYLQDQFAINMPTWDQVLAEGSEACSRYGNRGQRA